jgi:hypothetical protein
MRGIEATMFSLLNHGFVLDAGREVLHRGKYAGCNKDRVNVTKLLVGETLPYRETSQNLTM